MEATVAALLETLEAVRGVFTSPTFENFRVLALGWMLTPGHHAVTAALVVTGISKERDHSAFHRFFSLARWSRDELGRALFFKAMELVPKCGAVLLSLDDTLANKKGEEVFGIGCHIDAVRSTKKHKVFAFGHVWIVLCLVVRLPFSERPWSLPVLFRLYRSKKECESNDGDYLKKTELAREMMLVFSSWEVMRRVEIVADSAYCNNTVVNRLPPNLVFIGTMRPDAAVTAKPRQVPGKKQTGRPRVRGDRRPSPEQLAKDDSRPWNQVEATLYGENKTVDYKEMRCQWYRACGGLLLKIIVTPTKTGKVPYRVFFCTDPMVSVQYLLEQYASRWSIEVTFFDIKQYLGFADSQAWSEAAVQRTAPFVGYLYTFIVIWYATAGKGSPLDIIPHRPWYTTKRCPSFADMLGAAQRASALSGVFDPANNTNNLQNYLGQRERRRKKAA